MAVVVAGFDIAVACHRVQELHIQEPVAERVVDQEHYFDSGRWGRHLSPGRGHDTASSRPLPEKGRRVRGEVLREQASGRGKEMLVAEGFTRAQGGGGPKKGSHPGSHPGQLVRSAAVPQCANCMYVLGKWK